MRLSVLCLLSTSLLVAGGFGAGAQEGDPIAERQQLMKDNGRAARTATQMIRGETPFDAASAAEVFRELNETAMRFGDLFPEGTETGGDTEAAPAIWERPEEFQAAVAAFGADTAAALEAAPADLDAFRTAFGPVGENCQSCHEEFRLDN